MDNEEYATTASGGVGYHGPTPLDDPLPGYPIFDYWNFHTPPTTHFSPVSTSSRYPLHGSPRIYLPQPQPILCACFDDLYSYQSRYTNHSPSSHTYGEDAPSHQHQPATPSDAASDTSLHYGAAGPGDHLPPPPQQHHHHHHYHHHNQEQENHHHENEQHEHQRYSPNDEHPHQHQPGYDAQSSATGVSYACYSDEELSPTSYGLSGSSDSSEHQNNCERHYHHHYYHHHYYHHHPYKHNHHHPHRHHRRHRRHRHRRHYH